MREDWVECKIGDVFTTVTGNTPSKKDKENYNSNDIPFIKPPDILNKPLDSCSEYISNKAKSKARILPVNSVLVTCIGNLGRIGINSLFEVAFNQQINAIIPNELIIPKFVFYSFQNSKFRNQLESLSTSTTVALVNKSNFDSIRFSFPPLPEQRAIVKKIETLFSSLDNGIADLKKAQLQLKIFRQAVLKKAFEGIKDKQKVSDIAFVETGATPKRGNLRYWENGTIPWITSGALNNEFVKDYSEQITETAIKETNCKIIPQGSLLIAMYGEGKTRGKCSELTFDATTNQAVAAIILKEEFKSSKPFLKWFFIKNYNDIRLLSSGGVQPNLNLSIIKNTEIPLPSLNEQRQIVKEIESRLSVCDAVEAQIKESLEKAAALRQSILKKAFEGKLLTAEEIQELGIRNWELKGGIS